MVDKIKVKAFKNGVEIGWYKDILPGVNAVKALCEQRGWDISQYDFRLFDDTTQIVWRGSSENN
jgi:hypothetical protein